jgi:hypothetical protein
MVQVKSVRLDVSKVLPPGVAITMVYLSWSKKSGAGNSCNLVYYEYHSNGGVFQALQQHTFTSLPAATFFC